MSCEHFKQQTLHPTLHYTIKHPLPPNPKTLKPKPSRQTRPSCLKRSGRSASQLGHTRLRVELCCLFYHNHLGTVAGVLFKLVQDPAAFHCWELPMQGFSFWPSGRREELGSKGAAHWPQVAQGQTSPRLH